MTILNIAWQSLVNRKLTAFLTILSIALSVALLLGVEKTRTSARSSFINSISGTDLIVGARAGSVQLLLYSVFHMGNATANVTWKTVQDIRKRPEVKWVVPISLGDSHFGFRVMGTSKEFFSRFRYRRDRQLKFSEGEAFDDLFEATIGSDVAEKLGYKLGDKIVVAHGAGRVSFGADHADKPFVVTGILEKTATPVDRTVQISMEAIEAIHVGWESGAAPSEDNAVTTEAVRAMDLTPKAATALYVGLKSRIQTFSLQRWVNNYPQEAISAVLPGVAFAQLWAILGNVETALFVISAMVVFTAILGMVISILGTLNERRREMAILRAIGVRPLQLFSLFVFEATLLAFIGAVSGFGILYLVFIAVQSRLERITGLVLEVGVPTITEMYLLGAIIAGGFVAGAIPAIRAYMLSLSDGLMVRT